MILKPSAHRRRDSIVELSLIGGVNTLVGSCDPVYNYLYCWANHSRLLRLVTSDDWRHNDVIIEKVINIDQNSCTQTVMLSFQIVDRICRQSSWAGCEYNTHRRRRRDATRQLSRVGVGGVYWALRSDHK